jgi:hypothetical protein
MGNASPDTFGEVGAEEGGYGDAVRGDIGVGKAVIGRVGEILFCVL